MDEDDEEEMAMETGEPEPQEDVTPTERLWVGGIPSNLVGGDQALSSVLNINANRNITSLFSQFGKVKHSTVRVKAGENKSWALITFEDIASAKACYEEVSPFWMQSTRRSSCACRTVSSKLARVAWHRMVPAFVRLAPQTAG